MLRNRFISLVFCLGLLSLLVACDRKSEPDPLEGTIWIYDIWNVDPQSYWKSEGFHFTNGVAKHYYLTEDQKDMELIRELPYELSGNKIKIGHYKGQYTFNYFKYDGKTFVRQWGKRT